MHIRRGLSLLATATLAVAGLALLPAAPVNADSGSRYQQLAWGDNSEGQLGNGTLTQHDVPVDVKLPSGVTLTEVDAGALHSIGLATDGRVYAWGLNEVGQLGDGTRERRTTPVLVDLPAGTRVTDVDAGSHHSLAVTADGRVFAWGNNMAGQLGDGTRDEHLSPVEVPLPRGVLASQVSAGLMHSLVLTRGGGVLAWGWNTDGQLGIGADPGTGRPVESLVPAPARLPGSTTVTQVAAGDSHSLALTTDGRVLAWGRNTSGQVSGAQDPSFPVPVPVTLPAGVTAAAIDTGAAHSLTLTTDGLVLAWGDNTYGQVSGPLARRAPVTSVPLPAPATRIEAGGHVSLAVVPDGLLGWGRNGSGQLGENAAADQTSPTSIPLPSDARLLDVAAGDQHALALVARAPTAPSDVRATGRTDRSVSLAWSASRNAVKYQVYDNGRLTATTTRTRYTLTALKTASRHQVRVVAVAADGRTASSPTRSVTTRQAHARITVKRTSPWRTHAVGDQRVVITGRITGDRVGGATTGGVWITKNGTRRGHWTPVRADGTFTIRWNPGPRARGKTPLQVVYGGADPMIRTGTSTIIPINLVR